MILTPTRTSGDKTLGAGLAGVRRVEGVVNAASGSVGPRAADLLRETLAAYGFDARIQEVAPRRLAAAVRSAVEARPDLLVILAGDGTANLAANLVGPDGPLLAPLPGGTMNLLPHALYGARPWREALELTLSSGVVRPVSGGEVDGRNFYVAAILGLPALWADAREAVRTGRIGLALARARRALAHTFRHSVHYSLEGSPQNTTEALMLLCPIVSRGLHPEGYLEAAALDPKDVRDAVRLGFNAAVGRWRADPAVTAVSCRCGRAFASRRIPAVLDGEPCRLPAFVEFSFREVAFRALAPAVGEQGRLPLARRS